jgi:hypothetical protein
MFVDMSGDMSVAGILREWGCGETGRARGWERESGWVGGREGERRMYL